MTAETDKANGIIPTENTSEGDTGVKANSSRKGMRLAPTAIICHFTRYQYSIYIGIIIINRNQKSAP